jgi:hypothetical protein
MHRVTLQDGTVLDGLTLNGNNYISDTIIDSDVFADNLATVEISDGKKSQVYEDMKLIANQISDGKSWFILAEKTETDKYRDRVDRLETTINISADKLTILADGIDTATITAEVPTGSEYCFVTVNGEVAEKATIEGNTVVRAFTAATPGIYRVDFHALNRIATAFVEVIDNA